MAPRSRPSSSRRASRGSIVAVAVAVAVAAALALVAAAAHTAKAAPAKPGAAKAAPAKPGAAKPAPAKAAPKPAPAPPADPKREAQQLLTEGVALLRDKKYEDALDRFLAAYDRFPSPKILLDVGSTLRDMGRLADAANTYERYLEDPRTGADRVAEVKGLLNQLDTQVALVVIDVTPPGSDVSIDGGPWTTVGASLTTRLSPGPHLVRARKAGLEDAEVSINGFAGTRKEVSVALKVAIGAATGPGPDAPPPAGAPAGAGTGTGTTTDGGAPAGPAPAGPAPTNVNGWLITGPHAGRVRSHQGHSGTGATPGHSTVAVGESLDHIDDDTAVAAPAPPHRSPLGASLQTRVDGKLRGAAFAIAVQYQASPQLQTELALLVSHDVGGYAGARLFFLPGLVRPLVGAGFPVFWSGGAARIGVRVGGGAELVVNDHLSFIGDLGFEHFFNPQDPYEANVIVPILGVEGRL